MATSSGGGSGDSGGNGHADKQYHPLARSGRPRYNRQLSREDIGNQSRILLTRFIHDRIEANGLPNAPTAESLIDSTTPTGPPVEHIQEVAEALIRIGDELDGDTNLQRLIAQIPPDSSKETFLAVAREVFADGNFNWGRVTTLFYFAYKMALKAIQSALDVIPVIKSIIEWVVSYIVENVARWIIDRGGWEAIQEWFGSTSTQCLVILLSGVLCSLFSIGWKIYKTS